MTDKLCIGLTGRMASGKGEAVKILQRHGFRTISLSDIVREAAAGGDPAGPNRAELQEVGNRLRREGGAGILGRLVREKIEASTVRRWVIDGIRHPAEVSELRRLQRFVLLGLEAPLERIQQRIRARGRPTDPDDEAELQRILDREWGIGQPADGQQVGGCFALSDFVLDNSSTLEALAGQIEAILSRLGGLDG